MRACWLKWVGRDWSISADYIWLNYSDANIIRLPHQSTIFSIIIYRFGNCLNTENVNGT